MEYGHGSQWKEMQNTIPFYCRSLADWVLSFTWSNQNQILHGDGLSSRLALLETLGIIEYSEQLYVPPEKNTIFRTDLTSVAIFRFCRLFTWANKFVLCSIFLCISLKWRSSMNSSATAQKTRIRVYKIVVLGDGGVGKSGM